MDGDDGLFNIFMSLNIHLKMIKIANFILGTFYHNKKISIKLIFKY